MGSTYFYFAKEEGAVCSFLMGSFRPDHNATSRCGLANRMTSHCHLCAFRLHSSLTCIPYPDKIYRYILNLHVNNKWKWGQIYK